MFTNLEFFLKEAWAGIRRGGMMTVISLATITISLTIFGLFLLLMLNLNTIHHDIESKIEVVAYVNQDLDEWTKNKLKIEILNIPGVLEVKYIPKEEAWSDFKKDRLNTLDFSDIIKENPLPNTFILRLKAPRYSSSVKEYLENLTIINYINHSDKVIDQLKIVSKSLRLGGLILVLLLGVATLLIVVNTIRLTVISREKDISIMRLVGATDPFIKWPFIIEGIIIGILGASLSFIILKSSYALSILKIKKTLYFIPLVTNPERINLIYLIVVVVGIGLGMLGGYLSVSKSLKGVGK